MKDVPQIICGKLITLVVPLPCGGISNRASPSLFIVLVQQPSNGLLELRCYLNLDGDLDQFGIPGHLGNLKSVPYIQMACVISILSCLKIIARNDIFFHAEAL